MISNEQQEQKETAIRRLTRTLEASVSPYHCIQEAERQLSEAGFTPLALTKNWELAPNGRYYINAFDSTLLAFTLGSDMMLQIAPITEQIICNFILPNPFDTFTYIEPLASTTAARALP